MLFSKYRILVKSQWLGSMVSNGNTEFFNISDDILHEIIKYIE